jgi:hypothetical protein
MMASSSTAVQSRGIKRGPSNDLESEQRLTKRFNLLNLGTCDSRPSHGRTATSNRSRHQGQHGSNTLYVPVDNKVDTSVAHLSKQPPDNVNVNANDNDNAFMEVEDTKHKVYIYDLDKELAEAESDEDRPIFIPDIEKHLHKIPKHILIGDDAKAMANMQMVVYNVPTSLTVPKEQDSVRRAIIESRQRARERQALGELTPIIKDVRGNDTDTEATRHLNAVAAVAEEDSDAMEID